MTDRTMRQITARSIYQDLDHLKTKITMLGRLTSPRAHQDSIEKIEVIQKRAIAHMHQEDRP